MSWRKCLVRGLIFAVLGALASGSMLYQRLTCPTAVREQVVGKLTSLFLDTDVRLESAGLRLLGGISISDLRLIRRYDLQQPDFLYVPSAVIYHDKEQLLDGKLAIRKLELHRPRFHIIRSKDGRWNCANLLGPVDISETIPTIVIQQGTILIEDRLAAPDAAPLVINNVNLTLINDPRPTLAIQFQGLADLFGPLTGQARWHRATSGWQLDLQLPAVAVGSALIQRLAGYCPTLAEHAQQLAGTAQLQLGLTYDPALEQPLRHHCFCQFRDGRLSHPRLPVSLEDIEANLSCTDGRLRLDKLTARSGLASLEITDAVFPQLHPDGDLDVPRIVVQRLPINPELFSRLPDNLRRFQDEYAPVGTLNLEAKIHRRSGQWERHVVVSSNDTRGRFFKFPYPLEKVQGRIEEHLDEANHLLVRTLDLVGIGSASRPVHVQGSVTGEGPHPAVQIDIWGENLPIDEAVLAALPEKHQKIARSFDPTGLADFVIHIRRKEGEPQYANRFTIRVHDATARYAAFPYPVENVRGVLEIFPDHFEFRDFQGRHKGGSFQTWGRSHPVPGSKDKVSISIQGQDILLDDELEAALPPKVRAAWKALAPAGRMNLEAQVEQLPDRPDEIAVTVTAEGCAVRPTFFPYRLNDVSGTVRYAHGKVDLERLSGRHGSTLLSLTKGDIVLKPTGGFWARLEGLQGHPIILDQDFRSALPPVLKKVCGIVADSTAIGMISEVVIDMPSEPNLPPDIYWDGGISFHDAALDAGVSLEKVRGQLWCRGRHDGRQLKGFKGNMLLEEVTLFRQPFHDVHSHLLITPEAPEVLRMPDLKARIFGGDVGGEIRVEFGPQLHYEVNMTALQVRLEDVGQHNLGAKGQWKGQASGRLYLKGHGRDIHGLEGHGSLDVPNGQMYNLPLLLDLIKVLGLRPPDRTAFEEAHAAFSIRGPRLKINRLDLDGNAISLSGQGEMKLDGTDMQLDFYAVWGRIKQMLPPIFRDIPPAVGQQLLKIKMRGTVNDPKITKEPVPALVEPMEKLVKRFTARAAEARKAAEAASSRGQVEVRRPWSWALP